MVVRFRNRRASRPTIPPDRRPRTHARGHLRRPVDMTGYEEWTFGPDGLIAVSDGHYDQAEFERQMAAELP